MKKPISIILICLMLIQAVPAFAANDGGDNSGSDISDIIISTEATEETSTAEVETTETTKNTEETSSAEIICMYPTEPVTEEIESTVQTDESETTAPKISEPAETTLPFPTVSGETESTEPETDPEIDTFLGKLKSGCSLFYIELPPPPWMNEFDYQYGKYIFTNFNGEGEQNHGFYVRKVYTNLMLSEAFEQGLTNIDEVVSVINKYGNAWLKNKIINTDDVEKLVKERYNRDSNLEYIGIISSGFYLFYDNPKPDGRALCDWEQEFDFGSYHFHEYAGHTGNVEPEDLGLYVLHDHKILNIKEALGLVPADIWTKDLVELIKSKDLPYSFEVSPNTVSTTAPHPTGIIEWPTEFYTVTIPETEATSEKAEETTIPQTTVPQTTAPETVQSQKTTAKTVQEQYVEFWLEDTDKYTAYDIIVDLFKNLKKNIYLVHSKTKDGNSKEVIIYANVDKYIYRALGSAEEVYIFDAKAKKEYSIITAYDKGIISKDNLKTISKTLGSKKNMATFKENIVKINAGAKTPLDCLSGGLNGSKIKISNKKVIKFLSDKNHNYRFIGLKKGTATVTFTPKTGKAVSLKISVKTDPKFTNKKGKKITSVTVKKGKTVKVFIKGKAETVNNKYKNTKRAKIKSKKSASVLKIKGLKKGKTTLSITVNGVKLKLKVKVK